MRKTLTVAALVALAAPASVAAQTIIGIGGGFSSSSVGFEPEESEILQDSRTGFRAFGFLGFPLSETFRFQPGLAYGQKGAKDTSSSVDHELELTYLELPLLGVLSLPTEGAVGLHVFAGPAIGFELGASGAARVRRPSIAPTVMSRSAPSRSTSASRWVPR